MPSLKDMLSDQLFTLMFVQHQLLDWIGDIGSSVPDRELSDVLYHYASQSKKNLSVLEHAMRHFPLSGTGFKSDGIIPFLQEGRSFVEHYDHRLAKVVAMITTLQKIDCYEITCYRTAQLMANALGDNNVASMLSKVVTARQEISASLNKMSGDVLGLIASASSEGEA